MHYFIVCLDSSVLESPLVVRGKREPMCQYLFVLFTSFQILSCLLLGVFVDLSDFA